MSKSRRWPKILAIIVVLIVVFILTAPASLLKDQVQQANLPVQVTGYQGRLLKGKVNNIFVNGVSYSNLSWDLQPLAMLTGQFSAMLTLADDQADISVDVNFKNEQNWQVSELNGRLGLVKLTQMSSVLELVKPGGELIFNDVASVLQNALFSDTTGTLNWQNARVNINNQTLPLGLIEGQLSDDGNYLYLDFTGQDSIQPAGQIKLAASGAYELSMSFNPDNLPANMSWLRNMGKADGSGRVALGFKGQL